MGLSLQNFLNLLLNNMKILYYSPHPILNTAHEAGYATHINEMIEAFRNLGHDVMPVIMGGTKANNTKENVAETGKLKKFAKKLIPKIIWETLKDIQLLRFDKYAAKKLDKAIKSFHPDLIYERANFLQLSGIKMAKKRRIKHVLEINSPYVKERTTLQGKSLLLKKALSVEKEQLSQTNLPVVVSSALQNYFSEKHGFSKESFLITPNAINLNSFSVNMEQTESLSSKYKPNNEIIIGFVGSFFPWHGIDLLIKAFAELTEDSHNIKLMIIGSGEIETELKKLANKLCPKKIIFTGKVPHIDIFNYISLFDIAVMANSNWYGSPVKIFEYAILKKPIIAPDFVPLQDVMENKKDALLIQPNIKNIKSAMQKLISDKQVREKLSENFYNKIINNYTWEKNAINVLEKINT